MPKLPEFSSRRGIENQNQASANLAESGQAQVFDQIGRIAGGIGSTLSELQAKREAARDNEAALGLSTQAELDLKMKMVERQKGSYEGYGEDIAKFAEKRFEEDQRAMPSEEARQRYVGRMKPVMMDMLASSNQWENSARAKDYEVKFDARNEKAASLLLRAPRRDFLESNISALVSEIEENRKGNLVWDQATADRKIKEVKARQWESYFDGLYTSDSDESTEMLEIGLKEIKGQAQRNPSSKEGIAADGETDVSYGADSGLGPDRLAVWAEKFQSALKTKNRVKLGELSDQMANYKAALLMGTPPNPEFEAAAVSRLKSAKKTDVEIKLAMDELKAASDVGSAAAGWKTASATEIRNALLSSKSKLDESALAVAKDPRSGIALRDREASHKALQNVAKGVLERRGEDPAVYIGDNFSAHGAKLRATEGFDASPIETQERIKESLRYQSALEIETGSQRVTSRSERQLISAALSTDNAAKKSAILDQIGRKYGEFYPRVMSEVAMDGNKDATPLLYASSLTDPSSRKSAIENTLKATDIWEGVGSLKKTDILDKVDAQARDLLLAVRNGDTSATGIASANHFKQLIGLEAAKMHQLHGTPIMDAVEEAAKQFRRSWTPIVTDGSTFVIPRATGADVRVVEAFVRSRQDPTVVQTMNIATPNGVKPEDWAKHVSRKAVWRNTSDQRGIALHVRMNDSTVIPVYTVSGQIVTMPFSNLTRETQDAWTLKELD
jgi:hypothetical protein